MIDGSAAGAPLSKAMISIKITAEIHEGKDTLDRDCWGMSVLVQLSAEKQLHAVMVKLKKSIGFIQHENRISNMLKAANGVRTVHGLHSSDVYLRLAHM